MKDIEYPTRCKIVDVTGKEVLPGIKGRTPNKSKPHIGKVGGSPLTKNDYYIVFHNGDY